MWTIIDQSSRDACRYPATRAGDYAQRVLGTFLRDGPQPYIANADVSVFAAVAGAQVLPLVTGNPNAQGKNSYVCSPTTHYLDYTLREIEIELPDQPVLRRVLPPLINAFRPLMRWSRFEQVVLINNWLLSTNLYPTLDKRELQHLCHQLVQAFPRHTLVFRSVNAGLNGDLLHQLCDLGCYPVFSRQVYLLDPSERSYRRKKSFQKDVALAKRTPYRWHAPSQLQLETAPRLNALYTDLYLHKYSFFNPQFTNRFVEQALRDEWLTLYALEAQGRFDAVLGFVQRNGVMTAPFIGYDRRIGADAGLYRLISLKLVEEAAARGLILNQSSGAASFKRHRGSMPALEYNLVYDAHLPLRQRLPWRILAHLTRTVIIPLMQHYGL